MSEHQQPDPATIRNQMILLPFVAQEAWSIESLVVLPSPWGAPLLMGLRGITRDGDPLLCIVNETPRSWLRPTRPLDHWELETLHLQRLAVDCRCSTGNELFDALERGPDPPDAIAIGQGVRVGWELTSLAIAERRHAHALFLAVRQGLGLQQRHRVGHLSGYFIHMWFGVEGDPTGLPYRRSDQEAVDQLVESLVAFRPDPDHLRTDSSELPQQVTNFEPVHAPGDVTYFSVPLLGAAPSSPLFALTGIEVGLAFQSQHTADGTWSRLRDLINRKDRPGSSVLLVSVGAPDANGNQYPAEEVLAEFLLEHPQPIEARHLSAIVLHFWSTGRAVNLLGQAPQEMWPALYGGITPAFQPFADSTDAELS